MVDIKHIGQEVSFTVVKIVCTIIMLLRKLQRPFSQYRDI